MAGRPGGVIPVGISLMLKDGDFDKRSCNSPTEPTFKNQVVSCRTRSRIPDCLTNKNTMKQGAWTLYFTAVNFVAYSPDIIRPIGRSSTK